MGEIRRTLMDKHARNPFHASRLTRNFNRGMRLDAACSAPTLRLHPST